MNNYTELIAAIFKVINFGIVFALGIYIFYKKLFPSLLQKMAERQALFPRLLQQRQDLHNQELNIDTAIEQQVLVAKVLQKKIAMWSAYYLKEQEGQQKEIERMRQLMQKKIMQQEEFRFKNAVYAKVIPEIIKSTQDYLEKKFSQPQESQRYMHTILQKLK